MKKLSLVLIMSVFLIFTFSGISQAQYHPELKINNNFNTPSFKIRLVFTDVNADRNNIFKIIEFPGKTNATFTFTDIPYKDNDNKFELMNAYVLDYDFKWIEIDTSDIKVILNDGRTYKFNKEHDSPGNAIRVINMVGEGGND